AAARAPEARGRGRRHRDRPDEPRYRRHRGNLLARDSREPRACAPRSAARRAACGLRRTQADHARHRGAGPAVLLRGRRRDPGSPSQARAVRRRRARRRGPGRVAGARSLRRPRPDDRERASRGDHSRSLRRCGVIGVQAGRRPGIGARGAACMSCVRLGLRETWSERPAIAGSILTYALLLGVWASLWKLVPDAALARLSLRYEQLVWYFALTELVPFSVGHCYRQIESEIQAGGATPYLVRPIGYTALCGMLELGHTAAKLAFIGPAGCALAFLLTGTVPLGAAQVPPLAVLLVGGASIYLGV